MNASDFTNSLESRGAHLSVEGDVLNAGPARLLTREDRQSIIANKPSIMAHLRWEAELRDLGNAARNELLPGPALAAFTAALTRYETWATARGEALT